MKTIVSMIFLLVFSKLFCQNPFVKEPKPFTATEGLVKPTSKTIAKPTIGCISGNCTDGWGEWKFETGSYEGFWVNGKRNGFGYNYWDNGGYYLGFFKDNIISGTGIYQNIDEKIFRGNYENGMLNGFGEEIFYDYDEFGEFDLSKRGIYKNHVLETSYEFESNYVDSKCTFGNCTDKFGLYKWDNGDEFEGFFKGGYRHFGMYYFSNGDTYFGYFNSGGQMSGQGIYNYKDGSFYGGEFLNGKFHGKGYSVDKDGKTKMGIWENGLLIKPF